MTDGTIEGYGELMAVEITCPCGTKFTVKPSHAERAHYCSRACVYKYRADPPTKHGMARKGKRGYLYGTWKNIKARCYQPNHPHYKHYGARGISLFPEWLDSPVPFAAWVLEHLGERPEGHSIDRIDNDGNYEPGNLRWASSSQQLRNRRGARLDSTSKYIGVSLFKPTGRWVAKCRMGPKNVHIGYFATEEEAHEARMKFMEDNRII